MARMQKNVRKNPRINIERESKKVQISVTAKDSSPFFAKLVNVSTYGMALSLQENLDRGAPLSIRLKYGTKAIQLAAHVRWTKATHRKVFPYSAGIQFDDLNEKQVANLGKLICNVLSKCSKASLLKKISDLYMMGYYAEADLHASTAYYIERDISHERSLKKMKELFEAAVLLIEDSDKVSQLKQIYDEA